MFLYGVPDRIEVIDYNSNNIATPGAATYTAQKECEQFGKVAEFRVQKLNYLSATTSRRCGFSLFDANTLATHYPYSIEKKITIKYPKYIFAGIIAIALSGCGNSINRLDQVTWLEIR